MTPAGIEPATLKLEFPTQPAFRTVRQQYALKKTEESPSSLFFSEFCCLTVLKAGCVGNSKSTFILVRLRGRYKNPHLLIQEVYALIRLFSLLCNHNILRRAQIMKILCP